MTSSKGRRVRENVRRDHRWSPYSLEPSTYNAERPTSDADHARHNDSLLFPLFILAQLPI